MSYSQVDDMVLMGIACTYFAIISTGMSIIEMFAKIADIICQKISKLSNELSDDKVAP